jgi:hypothetical protein
LRGVTARLSVCKQPRVFTEFCLNIFNDKMKKNLYYVERPNLDITTSSASKVAQKIENSNIEVVSCFKI